jgi:2-keto-4-pentenoate hydratase/2-oxohepta-3-ene-1,7-dioic acid hydratase in catechol pathway
MKHANIPSLGTDIKIENIFCIGRNYVAHINELGNRQEHQPIVFLKPTSSLLHEGMPIHLPAHSNDVHYETELVLLIGKDGKNVSEEDAWGHIAGYGIGLDLTARDLQSAAKTKGLPWTLAKGFDGAACISTFIPYLPNPQRISFEMRLNSELRQQGNTSLMLFDIPYLISYLSTHFSLTRGDLIFTGTPEGVGQLKPGDTLELDLAGQLSAQFCVESP